MNFGVELKYYFYMVDICEVSGARKKLILLENCNFWRLF